MGRTKRKRGKEVDVHGGREIGTHRSRGTRSQKDGVSTPTQTDSPDLYYLEVGGSDVEGEDYRQDWTSICLTSVEV